MTERERETGTRYAMTREFECHVVSSDFISYSFFASPSTHLVVVVAASVPLVSVSGHVLLLRDSLRYTILKCGLYVVRTVLSMNVSSLFIWTQRTEGIGFQIISLRNYMSPWPAPRRASSYLGLRLQTALSLGMELNKIIIRLFQFIFNGNFRASFHRLHTIKRNYL